MLVGCAWVITVHKRVAFANELQCFLTVELDVTFRERGALRGEGGWVVELNSAKGIGQSFEALKINARKSL